MTRLLAAALLGYWLNGVIDAHPNRALMRELRVERDSMVVVSDSLGRQAHRQFLSMRGALLMADSAMKLQTLAEGRMNLMCRF